MIKILVKRTDYAYKQDLVMSEICLLRFMYRKLNQIYQILIHLSIMNITIYNY